MAEFFSLVAGRAGIALALYPFHHEMPIEIQRAPDDGGGGPDTGSAETIAKVAPGVVQYVDPVAMNGANWHYRIRHVGETETASDYTSWVAATAMVLPAQLPPNPPEPLIDLDMFVDPVTGEITLIINASERCTYVLWDCSINDAFPDPTATGTQEDTDADGDATILVPTGTYVATPGDVVRAAVAYYDKADRLIGILRRAEMMGLFLTCFPVLDEDDGKLYLYPYRGAWAQSVHWLVKTNGVDPADAAEVIADGSVSTADEIEVHTFTTDGESVIVGVVPAQEADGSGETGDLRILRYTYHDANNRPIVTWDSFLPDTEGFEGVRLIARDDSATCRIYYRTYTAGSTPGAYTDTGLLSDPVVVDIEVSRPTEDSDPTIVEYYAEDSDGNKSSDNPMQVRVDGNLKPSGTYSADLSHSNDPKIRISTQDPDTGSWRLTIKKTSDGSFHTIAYNDALAYEFSGNTFNGELVSVGLSYGLDELGDEANCELRFYRTTSTTDSDQSGSMKSSPIRFTITKQKGFTIPSALIVAGTGTGTNHKLTATYHDPDNLITAVSWESQAGGTHFTPNADPASWAGYDNSIAGGWDDEYEVASVEKHNSYIAHAIRYNLLDGEGNIWTQPTTITFDQNDTPKIETSSAAVVVDSGDFKVKMTGGGDSDWASLRYAYSTSSMPSDATVDSGTYVDGTTWNFFIGTSPGATFSEGDTVYIKYRGYGTAGGTGTTTPDYHTFELTVSTDTMIPTVSAVRSVTTTQGKVDLVINDPGGFLEATSFDSESGPGAFAPGTDPTSWTGYDATATDVDYTVNRAEKHVSSIIWGVGYDLGLGDGVKWITGSEDFAAKHTAEAAIPNASFDIDDNLIILGTGDPDCSYIYFTFAVGTGTAAPTPPSDPAGTETEKITGDNGSYTTSTTVLPGQTVIIKARGKNSEGNMGPTRTATIVRPPPAPRITSVELAVNDNGAGSYNRYTVDWERNYGVNDTDHEVDIQFFENDLYVGESVGITPSDDGEVWDDAGAGDAGSDDHYCVVMLMDAVSGAVLQTVTSRVEMSTT